MAKISLKQKLDNLALVVLTFVGISHQKDSKGKYIAILQLEEPKEMVRGSQEFDLNDGKGRRPVIARDVTEIKCHEDDFDNDLKWDDTTETGEYKGSNLILDVSQNGQVWLRRTSFAAGSQAFRATARNTRLAAALNGTKENTTSPKEDKMNPVETP